MEFSIFAYILAVFLVAGLTKGVIGLGLPTISMGLLAIVLSPVEAAALLILPSLVTNVWQMVDGPHLKPLLRRLWPLNLGVCLGTWAGAAFLSGLGGPYGAPALGIALIAYALSGLAALRLVVPAGAERWLGPVAGASTGAITAATGVFVVPAVPYLQAMGLTKDELVQALGLSFTVSTVALAVTLAGSNVIGLGLAWPSVAGVAVALVGMRLGQTVRARLSPQSFRLWFFAGLLGLGAYLAARGLL
ncbi:sulfite exporter TauE/SafE family protein [Reyranella sp.]|uniref:sulfite exporter TauE/SafE family protein n=1 Tax=Reyranella sp. TaxID=1929291 RepID=UPI003D1072CB